MDENDLLIFKFANRYRIMRSFRFGKLSIAEIPNASLGVGLSISDVHILYLCACSKRAAVVEKILKI